MPDVENFSVRNSNIFSLNADGIGIEDDGSVRISHAVANHNDDEGSELGRVDSFVVLKGHCSGNGNDGVGISLDGDERVGQREVLY